MSKITVQGLEKTVERNRIRKIVNFMLSEELGTRINIDLIIRFVSLEQTDGYCLPVDEGQAPREFLILVSSRLKGRSIITALAHEITHVRQYARGQLYHYDYDMALVKWMGQSYSFMDIPYRSHPWEIDAYGNQKALTEKALKSYP